MKLPRHCKKSIAAITGLVYCDCGENPKGTEDWVPGWMNGANTEDIYRKL
jgi:hypothetical protein